MKRLVVGSNFHCGHGMDTSASEARRILGGYGKEVKILPPLEIAGSVVSSSRIRSAVLRGDFHEAQTLLGRPFSIDLSGLGLGGRVHSVDRDRIRQILPHDGEYRVVVPGNESSVTMTVTEKGLSFDKPIDTSLKYMQIVP